MNRNVLNIVKFDFLNTLRSKMFIILNIILCLASMLLFNFNYIVSAFKSIGIISSNECIVEIYDPDGSVYEYFINNYDKTLIKDVVRKTERVSYTYSSMSYDTIAINVNDDIVSYYDNVEVITKDVISNKLYYHLVNCITDIKDLKIQEKYNISLEDVAQYKVEVELKENVLSEAENANTQNSKLIFAIWYVIFMVILIMPNSAATAIANEKVSKSAEYILSSVPAKDYLNGKVIAVCVKVFTIFILLVFYLLLGLCLNILFSSTLETDVGSIAGSLNFVINAKTIICILSIIAVVLLTIVLYVYIFSYIASKVKSISDLDTSTVISMILQMIPFYVCIADISNPIATNILSVLPFTSMYMLISNVILNRANIFLVLLSVFVIALTVLIVAKFVAKRFKDNILDLGKEKATTVKKEKSKKSAALDTFILKKYVTLVAFTLILSMVLSNVLGIFIPTEPEVIYLIGYCIVFALSLGIPALFLNKFTAESNDNVKIKRIKREEKIKMYLLGLAGATIAQVISMVIINIFKLDNSYVDSVLTVPSTLFGIALFIVQSAVFPAIFEELLFRKVMLNGAKKFGTIFAIVFTSVLFGLYHMNLPQIPFAILMGFVLAYISIKTGDVKVSMGVHFTNNFFSVLLTIASVQGFEKLSLICVALALVILVFAIVGIVLAIKIIIKNRKELAIEIEKKNIDYLQIFSNYYLFILFFMILLITVVINRL